MKEYEQQGCEQFQGGLKTDLPHGAGSTAAFQGEFSCFFPGLAVVFDFCGGKAAQRFANSCGIRVTQGRVRHGFSPHVRGGGVCPIAPLATTDGLASKGRSGKLMALG